MSDYPENWDFEEAGKATLEGKLVSINAVQAKKYGTDEMVEKFVANIEDGEGTTWAVWLDSAVLLRCFQDEARNRKAIGERFGDREEVVIEFLGRRQGATYKYKDFKVTFEYAAPSLDGFDALAGDSAQPASLATEEQPEPVEEKVEEQKPDPATDDIPF